MTPIPLIVLDACSHAADAELDQYGMHARVWSHGGVRGGWGGAGVDAAASGWPLHDACTATSTLRCADARNAMLFNSWTHQVYRIFAAIGQLAAQSVRALADPDPSTCVLLEGVNQPACRVAIVYSLAVGLAPTIGPGRATLRRTALAFQNQIPDPEGRDVAKSRSREVVASSVPPSPASKLAPGQPAGFPPAGQCSWLPTEDSKN